MFKFIKWTFGIIFIGIVGLIVVGTIEQSNQTPEEKAAAEAKQKAEAQAEIQQKQEQAASEMAAMPAYTAAEITKAYNDNSVAADQRFKGNKFKVTGVNPYMQPQFIFDKDAVGTIANLKKGIKVTLICVGKGDIAKTPMSDECLLM